MYILHYDCHCNFSCHPYDITKGFLGGRGVKNLPANAGDTGDVCLIPGLRRPSGEENGNPLQDSCLEKIPWTEEPGGLQSMGSQESRNLANKQPPLPMISHNYHFLATKLYSILLFPS